MWAGLTPELFLLVEKQVNLGVNFNNFKVHEIISQDANNVWFTADCWTSRVCV